MRSWFPRAAVAALALLLLAEIIIVLETPWAVALVAVAVWFALPGVAVARAFLSPSTAQSGGAWLIGPAIGFGFSVFGLLLLWAAGLQGWPALAAAPLFTWAVAWVMAKFGAPRLAIPSLDRRDAMALACALLVVPIVTWRPYSRVAEPLPEGTAYRAYFTADFVWAMSVTSELAKGDVPPQNPFLRGEPMRYYWMSHLLSGAVYRNVRSYGLTPEQIVLHNGLAFSVAFVAFFYWLIRAGGGSPAFAAIALAAAFLANSYEGVNRLWVLSRDGQPLELVRFYNIDAVTRWFYQGMPVDGLQRMFLYQPHHFTGYVLALAALWLAAQAEDVTATGVALGAGSLLGLGFLFSTFTAIIVGAAVGLVFAVRLVRRRAWVGIVQSAILGAAPVLVAVGISSALGYTDPNEGFLIQFGLNRVATRQWPFMLLLSFGPLLFAGIAGALRVRWWQSQGTAAAALAASALIFYFIADVPDMGGVWVGWRSGHLLLMAFAVMGAAALTTLWSLRRPLLRVPLAVVLAAALAAAIPTVAIDVYNAQDITNREQGPSFPWTLVISPAEREALDWIRRATPRDAVVQVEAVARDSGTWAYVPAFAERRMAAGLPISMIPLRPYQMAVETIRAGIFRARHAADAHTLARRLGIDYVLIGAPERQHYPGIVDELRAHPEFFVPVFSNDAVTVYGVAP